MINLSQLIELGGPSMMAILIVSIIGLAVILFKLVQFTTRGYWRTPAPIRADVRRAASGLRVLELATIIAPLLGLLGTVLGMITAFQTLESAGGAPEISLLAGGIWQALSTTAAGMTVAIIATIFLSLFDSTVDRMTQIIEDQK